jgi:L-alanine-DL-glutamate epimerase-like enolase superfamily enzyme
MKLDLRFDTGMKLDLRFDEWEMREPFVTAAETTTRIRTVTVALSADAVRGRGEALGVDYLGETADTIAAQIEGVRADLEGGVDPERLLELLPPGGARNAVDCALWDLGAKRAGRRVWELLGIDVRAVDTVYTLALDDASQMAAQAAAHRDYPILKLKLDAVDAADRIRAVRACRPDATLTVDANGSWSLELLDELADVLAAHRIAMVEQPLPRGSDAGLAGWRHPVPLCADESCQSSGELEQAAERYGMINIKLDKCGGLTDALAMVEGCRKRGLPSMVGNMLGSSLAMAPGFVVAQSCRFVDLDGPLWQRTDRPFPMRFRGARVEAPDARLWG